MKVFKKPEFKINKMDELSEPVFMACSGRDLFTVDIKGYQHQEYQTGRYDCRFQYDAHYRGSDYTGPLYVVAEFDKPVDVSEWGWNFVKTTEVDGSFIVTGFVSSVHLNGGQFIDGGESVGAGNLIVTIEGAPQTAGQGVTLKNMYMTFNPNGCE